MKKQYLEIFKDAPSTFRKGVFENKKVEQIDVMVVGDMMSRDHKHPFEISTPEGQMVMEALGNEGWELNSKYKFYYTAAFKEFHSTKLPRKEEYDYHRQFLEAEIKLLKPRVLLVYGNKAVKMLEGKEPKMSTRMAKQNMNEEFDCHSVYCYTPRYLLKQDIPNREQVLDGFYKCFDTVEWILEDKLNKLTPYKLAMTIDDVKDIVKEVYKTGIMAFDWETTGLQFWKKHLRGTLLSISTKPGFGYAIPWDHPQSPFNNKDRKKIQKILAKPFTDKTIKKYGWNLKFDHKWNIRYDMDVKGPQRDGMLALSLLDENILKKGLKEATYRMYPESAGYNEGFVKVYKTEEMTKSYQMLMEAAVKKAMTNLIDINDLAQYGVMDTDMSLKITLDYEAEMKKDKRLWRVYTNLLMPASGTFAWMEYRGMFIDLPYLDKLRDEKSKALAKEYQGLINNEVVLSWVQSEKKRKRKEIYLETLEEYKKAKHQYDNATSEKLKNSFKASCKRKKAKLIRIKNWELTSKYRFDMQDVKLSGKQLAGILYSEEGFGVPIPKLTKKEQRAIEKKRKAAIVKALDEGKELKDLKNLPGDTPTTTKDHLLELSIKLKQEGGWEKETKWIDAYLEHSGNRHIFNTYIEGVYKHIDDDGYVHPNYKLNGTVTGRLSCVQPNLQNIPRDATADYIKRMFIAPPGMSILHADYSQAELRVMAAAANCLLMMQWFKEGKDVHTASAADAYGFTYDEINDILNDKNHPDHKLWKPRRKSAKTINFGMIYDSQNETLSIALSDPDAGIFVTPKQAGVFKDEFFERFPEIKDYMVYIRKYVEEHKQVRNLFGRIRHLPNIDSDNYALQLEAGRHALNAPIQGAGSDFTLFSGVYMDKRKLLQHLNTWQVGTVHDSLLFYCPIGKEREVFKILKPICEHPPVEKYFKFKMEIPLKIDCEMGSNWANVQEIKDL